MNIIITYDTLGQIKYVYAGTDSLHKFEQDMQEDYSYIEGDTSVLNNPELFYIGNLTNTPVIKEKEALEITISKTTILAGGIEETVISNIPEGVFVTWPDGQRDEVTDGVVEFSATQPDTYVLKFDGVKYLTEEVSIEAHV